MNKQHDLTARLFDDSDRGPLDPMELFELWLAQAIETEINDPTAMVLATVDADGLPDARMVLMNRRDARGLMFFTNKQSAKGDQLINQPKAALLFHWKSRRQQVRVRGTIEEVTPSEADAYFDSRPRGSQVGAHASAQSRPLDSRQALVERAGALEAEFGEKQVPRPEYWSGFRLIPQFWEFWQDGEFRLHNRVKFTRQGEGWTRQRLNP
jgi:pyridoxamine 5'-phosphate oxidase